MKIILNGKQQEINDETKLAELIISKGIQPEKVVVEYNYNILKKEEWDKTALKENDNIEVLNFVGGG